MTNKMNRYFRQFSICLILASYVTTPVQISAQESLDEMEAAELVEESTESLDEPFSDGADEIQDLVDFEETEDMDAVEKNDALQDIVDSDLEVENDTDRKDESDEEEDLTSESYSDDGYSHVETELGVVSATTPSDATIPQLIEYLEQHYNSEGITSLTVYGMIETGANEEFLSDFGLAKFTTLSYLQMVDVETVNNGALLNLYNLTELHLPKVKVIGDLAMWDNRSLLTFNAPLVEAVGINAFYQVSNLEVLITPMWTVGASSILFDGPTNSLKEISAANFSSGFSTDTFPNVTKQTINTPSIWDNWNWPASDNGTWIVFSGVEELTVTGAATLYANGVSLTGDLSNVRSLSSDTLRGVSLSDFPNLVEIDFEERLTGLYTNAFSGTKIESLNLSSMTTSNVPESAFAGANYLKEVYFPSLRSDSIPSPLNLPESLEIIGTGSMALGSFQETLINNSSVLFVDTESSGRLPLEDQQIGIGGSATLTSDLSSYILNDDLSQTSFELATNWFYEGELISASDTHSITNMSQNDVGKYNYSVDLTPTGSATYSGGRESRIAQIDIIDEINFTSDFSIESVVGELQELNIPFTSNQTNMFSTLQISIPDSIQVDEQNIQVYLDNGSPLPLNPTVSIENEVITISNYPLLTGFNYHISIPAMPIAVSKETDIVSVEFNGNYEPLITSGKVLITSGEFKVAIPDLIFFEEVALDSSSVRSTIEKENQLDIDITSFTGQEESWEILVSASSFRNEANEEIGESTMRMVYIDNDRSFDLAEELFLTSGSFDGSINYNFQDQTWENNSQKVSQLKDEGFHVFIGDDYYKLEDNHNYTTELTFTIQYSP